MSEEGARVSAAALAEIADLPYFRVDADRNVVEMSAAMERLTGFPASDAIGRSCLRVHRCEECLSGCGVFDEQTVLDKRLELYRADGTTVHVRKSGRVLLDGQGRITGAIEVVRPLSADPVEPVWVEPTEGAAAPSSAAVSGEAQIAGGGLAPAVTIEPGCEVTPAAAAARAEIDAIRTALMQARYHRTEAARRLGMSRTTLWRKMREYGL